MSQTITTTCLEVTLVYEDESTWFAGDFSSQESADSWINSEKTRPYWKNTTTVRIVDKSTAVTLP